MDPPKAFPSPRQLLCDPIALAPFLGSICLNFGTSSGWCEAQLLLWRVPWPVLPEESIIQS